MEKNARFWRYYRWLCVLMGIGMAMVGIWLVNGADRWQSILSFADTTTRPVDARELSERILASKVAMTGQMCIVTTAWVFLLIGSQMATWALCRWNRHKKELLIAKALRQWWAEQAAKSITAAPPESTK